MQTGSATSAREIPPVTRDEVAELATAELEASVALLEDLDDQDAMRPTDCAGWTVHDLTAHLVGQYQGLANPGVYVRRHRRAHRRYPDLSRLDADNRQQIDDLGGLPQRELVAMLAPIGAKAIRARRRVPPLLRRQRIGRMYPEEALPDDRLGYVLDVLGLRDPWMHRVDLARATGRPVVLGPHDRVVVAQVVSELGRGWGGPPVLLELSGPAGGCWTLGQDGPAAATVRAGTVDYLRALSGRNDHPALDVAGDRAVADAIAAARVVF
jgi:uncharacterized protein (TIGR03083 family)